MTITRLQQFIAIVIGFITLLGFCATILVKIETTSRIQQEQKETLKDIQTTLSQFTKEQSTEDKRQDLAIQQLQTFLGL